MANVMAETFVKAMIGEKVQALDPARPYVGHVVGLVRELRRQEWYLLVQAVDDPDAMHWAPMERFYELFRRVDHQRQ